MPNIKEMDRELMERLYDLLLIKNAVPADLKIIELERAIKRAKTSMTKEQIAWVEELVNEDAQ